jgi:hypothetical protein
VARYLRNRAAGLSLATGELNTRLAEVARTYSLEAVGLACMLGRGVFELQNDPRPWLRAEQHRQLLGAFAHLKYLLDPQLDALLDAVKAFLDQRHRVSSANEQIITFYQAVYVEEEHLTGGEINEEMETRSTVFDQRNDRRSVIGERAAGRRRSARRRVYTTDKERGGFLRAKITFFPNGDGTYRSSITGRYEDRDADNYCVKAFRTGGRERYDLGPAACPEGKSQAFDYQYSKATKAAVMVCRVNNKTHQLANCNGWK